MPKPVLIRITTVPLSLEKLLEGQLAFMSQHYDVTAVSSDKARLQRYAEAEGVDSFTLGLTRKITPFKDLAAVWRLYRFLKKKRPLIVHTHTPKAGIVGMLAARWAKVPIRIHTVAGLPLMEAKGFKFRILKWVEKLTYRCAHEVFPNSSGLMDFIVSEKLAEPSKLKVLGNGSSNGIDTSYFDPSHYSESIKLEVRNELGFSESDFVFVFVGRLVGDKGINELVEAFSKLSKNNASVKLLLVGPFEENLDPLSDGSLKTIQDHPGIVTTGYQEDIRKYLFAGDALVFPSYREGFPNVVLQAGAMGLPAIVSDINGCNEIVSHEKNGLIVPVKSISELEKAMLRITEDVNLYKRLTGSSREMVTSKFERSQFWQLLLSEYRELEARL